MRRSLGARAAALGAAAAVTASAAIAFAEEANFGAGADVSSGVEGGGAGHARGVRRARTLIRVGGDMRITEGEPHFFGASLRLEIEPHAAVGADVRYAYLAGRYIGLHVAAIAMMAPGTLFGAGAGADVRLPLGKRFAFTAGPTAQAFFLGSDLPDHTVLWQGLFHVGFHLDIR